MTDRERLIAKLDELTDEEIAALLHYIDAMQSTSLPDDYDEANDPAIGFFSAAPDFAESHRRNIAGGIWAFTAER